MFVSGFFFFFFLIGTGLVIIIVFQCGFVRVWLMDAKEKAVKGGELSISEKKAVNGSEVVISISTEGAKNANGSPSDARNEEAVTGAKPVPISSPPPEIRFSPSPNKPPKVPTANEATLTRRKTIARSAYSKPKSRFGEQPYIDADMFEEKDNLTLQEQMAANSPYRSSFTGGSPNNKSNRTNPITPKTPLMASPGGTLDDEVEEIYHKVELSKEKQKRFNFKVLLEWVVLVCIVGCLVASLTVKKLEKAKLWGLEAWKWFVMVLVIFSGMLVTNWIMHFIVFLIEKNFLLRKKVLYFVHGLKKSVQVFIWLCVVLLTWVLLFNHGVKRSETADKILDSITWTLVTILIGAFLWLIKTTLLKILACSFHVNRFFDRIQESVFHQYVLQTLSGPPLIEEAERIGRSPGPGQLSFRTQKGKDKKEKKVIDMGKFHKMKQEKVSAWTMKVLVDAIMKSGLSTISNSLDNFEGEPTDKEITNEMEATAAAYHVFRNVAQPGCK